MRVLGIETSCDETAASVVEWDGAQLVVRSSVVASQEALHAPFGGVVPELASRAHLDRIVPTVRKAVTDAGLSLSQLNRVGVANTPGLVGSLLVGVSAAKGLAWTLGLPIVPVDHVVAHLTACLLNRSAPSWPALGLVVSGGHTSVFRMDGPTAPTLIGWTIDDAIGEAFDKVASVLGLGYPGGPQVEREARGGDPTAVPLPSAFLRRDGIQFSFSGLKTALLYAAKGAPGSPRRPAVPVPELNHRRVADLCASFQRAAVGSVIDALDAALLLDAPRPCTLLVGGGVSANEALRDALAAWSARHGIECRVPASDHCIDNAAMIAGLAALSRPPSTRDLSFVALPMSAIARGVRGPTRRAS